MKFIQRQWINMSKHQPIWQMAYESHKLGSLGTGDLFLGYLDVFFGKERGTGV